MSKFTKNLNLTKSKFGKIKIWPNQNLTKSKFDKNQNLAKSKFGKIKIWPNQNLAKSTFDKIKIWQNQNLAKSKFGKNQNLQKNPNLPNMICKKKSKSVKNKDLQTNLNLSTIKISKQKSKFAKQKRPWNTVITKISKLTPFLKIGNKTYVKVVSFVTEKILCHHR